MVHTPGTCRGALYSLHVGGNCGGHFLPPEANEKTHGTMYVGSSNGPPRGTRLSTRLQTLDCSKKYAAAAACVGKTRSPLCCPAVVVCVNTWLSSTAAAGCSRTLPRKSSTHPTHVSDASLSCRNHAAESVARHGSLDIHPPSPTSFCFCCLGICIYTSR